MIALIESNGGPNIRAVVTETDRDLWPNRRSQINTCWLSKQNTSGLISPLAEIPQLISHTKIFYVNVHPAPD